MYTEKNVIFHWTSDIDVKIRASFDNSFWKNLLMTASKLYYQ